MKLLRRWAISSILIFGFVGTTGCAKTSWMSLLRKDASENVTESEFKPNSASHSNWHEKFVVAQRESTRTGKPILADFTGSDWCHWCVKLKQDVFETETFKQWATDNVVLLELDYPKRGNQNSEIRQQNADLAERYQIDSYPTVLLLNAKGEVLGKLGYQKDPSAWIASADMNLSGAK